MWDKRKFLYLLKRLHHSRKNFLPVNEYSAIARHGLNRAIVFRFVYESWDFVSILLIFLRIKEIPKNIQAYYSSSDWDYGQHDFINKISAVVNECESLGYIESFKDKETIKILYEGERFPKLFPFYNELFKKYDSIVKFLVGGSIGAIITGLIWLYKTFYS